jgi:hypothetical protein
VYPPIRSLIAAGACALAAAFVLAGCGGGGSSTSGPPQTVRGSGFTFSAPGKWHLSRTQGSVVAAPKGSASEQVSVSVFQLLRTYTPQLYNLVVSKELNKHAKQLAAQQNGKVVAAKDVQVAGIKSRQYELEYSSNGKKFGERITFVFRNKTEYELLCLWDASKSEPGYCGQLATSFKPT